MTYTPKNILEALSGGDNELINYSGGLTMSH